MNKTDYKGISAIIASTAIFGLYGVYSRLIGISFGAFTQYWTRNFLVALVLFVVLVLNKKWKRIHPQDIKWFVFWILNGIGSTVGIFVAFNNIPIGTAYFVFYSGIILAGCIAGRLLFHEILDSLKIVSMVLSVIGLTFIYSFTTQGYHTIWIFLAFASGICSGLWITSSKKLSHKYPTTQMIFLDAASGFALSLILALMLRENFPTISFSVSWIGILLFAVSQLATEQLIIYGFRHTQAQIGTLITPLEAVFGALFAFIFFKEVLSPTILFGGFLIIIAMSLPSLNLSRKTTR